MPVSKADGGASLPAYLSLVQAVELLIDPDAGSIPRLPPDEPLVYRGLEELLSGKADVPAAVALMLAMESGGDGETGASRIESKIRGWLELRGIDWGRKGRPPLSTSEAHTLLCEVRVALERRRERAASDPEHPPATETDTSAEALSKELWDISDFARLAVRYGSWSAIQRAMSRLSRAAEDNKVRSWLNGKELLPIEWAGRRLVVRDEPAGFVVELNDASEARIQGNFLFDRDGVLALSGAFKADIQGRSEKRDAEPCSPVKLARATREDRIEAAKAKMTEIWEATGPAGKRSPLKKAVARELYEAEVCGLNEAFGAWRELPAEMKRGRGNPGSRGLPVKEAGN